MAGLSDFGFERETGRQQLLSRLICKILNVQPGDDNHELALDFCLHTTQFHRYADTNPKAVDEHYESLQARMGVNAQFAKQKALQRLRALVLQLPLSKDTLEVHHRVLAALMCLSRRPLQSTNTPPSSLPGQPPHILLSAGEGQDAGSDVSELSAWDEVAALREVADSELSDWSDDGNVVITASPLPKAAPDSKPPASSVKSAKQLLSESWDFGRGAKARLKPAKSGDSPALEEGSLLHVLARSQGGGVSFPLASSQLLFTEQDLVFQVLHMLRGSPSPGRALTLSPNLDAFEVTAGAHVAHLSPSCLQNVLARFTLSGTVSLRLHAFVRAVRAAAATPSQTRAPAARAAPTLAAFAAALAAELAATQSALIGVQEEFAAAVRLGGNAAADVGLVALEAAVQAPLHRLELLEAAAAAVLAASPGLDSAAGQAAAVLNGLHAQLKRLAPDATPEGRAEVAVVVRLLARSARPLLEALGAWLQHGLLPDTQEFLVSSGEAEVPVEDANFWHDAFQLRTSETEGEVLCPAILRPLAAAILTAGKSSLLLRVKSAQDGRCSHVPAAAEGTTTASPQLYEDVLQRLKDAVMPERASSEEASTSKTQPGAGLRPSMAERMAASCMCSLGEPCFRLEVGAFAAERAVDSFSEAAMGAAVMQQPPHQHADVIGQPLLPPGEAGWGLSRHLAADLSADASGSASAYSSAGPPGLPRPAEAGQPDAEAATPGAAQPPDNSGSHGALWDVKDAHAGTTQTGSSLGHVSNVLSDVSNLGLAARQAPLKAQRSSRAGAEPQLGAQAAAREVPVTQRGTNSTATTRMLEAGTISGADDGMRDWYARMLDAMQNPRLLLDADRSIATGPASTVHGAAAEQLVPASVQATLIRPFSGQAVQQMWGARWQQQVEEDEGDAWLSELQDADLQPVEVAVQQCFLAPIQERVDRVGGQLLGSLMGRWGLGCQLAALHDIFLLASPAMQPFAKALFAVAEGGGTALETGAPGVFELQGTLEQCLSDLPGGPVLPAHCVTLRVASEDEAAAGTKRGNGVAALQAIRLRLQPVWPLSLVVQEAHMEQYNDILAFLLQVGWARASLQGARAIRSPAARGVAPADLLSWQMSHFVAHLHCFVMDRLMHAALPELSRALEAARTLDEVAAAHGAFLGAATRAAMVAKERTWVLVIQAVRRLLDLALRCADITRAGAAGAEEVAEVGREWRARHRYLMKLLTARSLRSGDFAPLALLASRLDFNHFYSNAEAAIY